VSRRPLVFVLGLTIGDYLVWNWSLNGNHTVIALASGLTLPPLALASMWLVAISAARLFVAVAKRRAADAPVQRSRSRGYRPQAAEEHAEEQGATATPAAPPRAASRKIAA